MELLKDFKQGTAVIMVSFGVLKAHSGGNVKEGVDNPRLGHRDLLGGYYKNPNEKSYGSGLRPWQ